MPARKWTRTPELMDQICHLVADEGLSIARIGDMPSIPDRRAIFRWLREDAGFAQQFMAASRDRGHVLAEEALRLVDECPPDKDAVLKVRAQADVRRWLAACLNPKVYSPRAEVGVTAKLGLLEVLGGSVAALQAAPAKALEHCDSAD